MSSRNDRFNALLKQQDQDAARAEFVIGLVALAFNLPAEDVRYEGRRPAAVRARQTAMYLTHVAFALPLQRVGIAFGRDRATVGHACNRVEEWREDPAYDALLLTLETCARAAPSASFP